MIELLKLPQFWIFLGTGITAAFGYARYRAKLNYMYTIKSEQFKVNSQIQMIELLKKVIEDIKPVIERHEKSIENLALIYANTTDMMGHLKNQYEGFEERMTSVSRGAGLVMEKLKGIQTEIVTIKDDLILVRTKK